MNGKNLQADAKRRKAAEAANAYEAAIIAQAKVARRIAPDWIARQRYEATVSKLQEAVSMIRALRKAGKSKLTLTECADLLQLVLAAGMLHPHRTTGERLLEGEEARARLAEIAGHPPTEADLDNAPPDLLAALEGAGQDRLIMDEEIKLVATLKARGRSKTTPLDIAEAARELAVLTPFCRGEDRLDFATHGQTEGERESAGEREMLSPRHANTIADGIAGGTIDAGNIQRMSRNGKRRAKYRAAKLNKRG